MVSVHAESANQAECNVIVMGDSNDAWLVDARMIVRGERKAGSQQALYNDLTELLRDTPDPNAIELISHSQGNNYLKLGQAILDANAFNNISPTLRAALGALPHKVLRIVGCSTLVGPDAEHALSTIARNLQLEVWGTNGLVGSPDLYRAGVRPSIRDGLMRKASNMTNLAPLATTDAELRRNGDPSDFPVAERQRVTDSLDETSRQLLDRVLPPSLTHYYTYPGILRVPSFRQVLYASSGLVTGSVDVLLQEQLLRVTRLYPEAKPKEYIFMMPEDLRDLVRTLPKWSEPL